ncbi:hypothetical protein [Mycobacteroides abscessus]|uniref:hypothetical protein n=1 Tax=Mycobacteroides abscessus TaxID=36809 RepID=UPI000C260964|nr:hypothetical protein [Mycobacteroides abscessus]
MDELMARIDAVLDDDESLDDWAYPWSDAMRWAPGDAGMFGVEEDQAEGELDCGWEWHPDPQIHVIPVEQVGEWTRWLGTLGHAEREDVAWYVVCFTCMTAGERSVTCECGNP